jgi:hypothetical protein
MRFASIVLTGFTLTSLCASVCPFTMPDMANMDHDGPMHAAATDHDMHAESACEHCLHNDDTEIALTTSDDEIVISPLSSLAIYIPNIAPVFSHTNTANLLIYVRPPPIHHTLVGTVILRT